MGISLLVPFRANGRGDSRVRSWRWVKKRWATLLPEAELCVGTDDGGRPFSKSVAVNDAFAKSTGDMLVIADADSWVEREQLLTGLERAAYYEHLVVPWWTAYRLTRQDSLHIMTLDPAEPNPITRTMKENAAGTGPSPASGAMVLIIQRRSFERVGGFDPRFRGWGSEDVSFANACWTLLGRNEYSMGESYALHHPQPTTKDGMRVWKDDKGQLNTALYERYRKATGHPTLMSVICGEHPVGQTPIGPSPTLNYDELVELPDMDVNNPPPPTIAHEAVIDYGDTRVTI